MTGSTRTTFRAGEKPDPGVQIHDLETGKVLQTLPEAGQLTPDWKRFLRMRNRAVVGHGAAAVTGAAHIEWQIVDVATVKDICSFTLLAGTGVGGAWFSAIRFSPDGARVAFVPHRSREEEVLRVYDTRTGKEVFTSPWSKDFWQMQFSPDGTRIMGDGPEGVVRVYDARRDPSPVTLNSGAVSVNLAHTRIAVPGFSGSEPIVTVYDTRDGNTVFRLKAPWQVLPDFSPDGATFALWNTTGTGRVLELHDASTGGHIRTLTPATNSGTVTFSLDGNSIAIVPPAPQWVPPDKLNVVGKDGKAIAPGDPPTLVLDTQTGKELLRLTLPRDHVRRTSPVVQFSPDSRRIISFPAKLNSGEVRVCDLKTGRDLLRIPVKASHRDLAEDDYYSTAVSQDCKRLAVVLNRSIHLYETERGTKVFTARLQNAVWVERQGGQPPFFSPDGRLFVVNDETFIRMYDMDKGRQLYTIQSAMATGITPDGKQLVLSNAAKNRYVTRMHDPWTGAELSASNLAEGLAAPAFTPNGKRFASAGRFDRTLRVFDTATGQQVLALPLTQQEVKSVQFSPDGSLLTVKDTNKIRFFHAPRDLAAWQQQRRKALLSGLRNWHQSQVASSEELRDQFGFAFHLERLLRADPRNGPNHLRRGFALAYLGDLVAAKQEFQAALAPGSLLDPEGQASAHAMLGNAAEASRLLAKAAETPNASVSAWAKHALLLLDQGDDAGFRKACATMLTRFGVQRGITSDVYWTCLFAPAALPDYKPALELAQQCVKRDPNQWQFHANLGATLYRANRYQEAADGLSQAAKFHPAPGDPRIDLFLAMAHHQLKKAVEAAACLARAQKALDMNPPVHWKDQVQCRLLRREAEKLLQPGQP